MFGWRRFSRARGSIRGERRGDPRRCQFAIPKPYRGGLTADGACLQTSCCYETGAKDSAFEPDTLVMAALGRATKSVDFVQSIENRQLHVRRLLEFHTTHNLLVTPTTATPPPSVGAFDAPAPVLAAQSVLLKVRGAGLLKLTPIVDQLISQSLGWVPYTQLANLTGRRP